MINVKDLRVADVRYFDMEHNGLEFTQPISKVILLNRGDTYINLLNPGEIAPIYRRVKKTSNLYKNGEFFGTKIEHVCGDEKTGEAWLLTNDDLTRFFRSEQVTLRQVEDYVLLSEDYFHNREALIDRRLNHKTLSLNARNSLINKRMVDERRKIQMQDFFEDRGIQKVYLK